MRIEVDDLTVENAARVKREALDAWTKGERTFDFSAVRHVDSAALALVASLVRRAEAEGARVIFTGLPAGLRSLAELYGVDALLDEYLPPAAR